MDEYKDIIRIIKDTPPVQPPGDFTERLMCRITAQKPGIWLRIWESLSRPRESDTLRAITGIPKLKDCSFYFFLGGFFYLIMGAILITGLKRVGGEVSGGNWIMLQPQIAFITSFGFMALGILLLRENLFVIRASHVGIFIYMGFVIINGIALQMSLRSPVAVLVNLYFTGGGLFVGTLLATIVQRYLKNLDGVKV